MLVQIAVKFSPGKAESAASAGGEGQAMYKQINVGGVAVSDRRLEQEEEGTYWSSRRMKHMALLQ